MGDFNADLIEPNGKTAALLNFNNKHSLKIVEHGATYRTQTTTTTFDTHMDLILVDPQDRLLNFNIFPSPYERNRHDEINSDCNYIIQPILSPL